MFHFYIPWTRQKTFSFLAFSGGRNIGLKWVKDDSIFIIEIPHVFAKL